MCARIKGFFGEFLDKFFTRAQFKKVSIFTSLILVASVALVPLSVVAAEPVDIPPFRQQVTIGPVTHDASYVTVSFFTAQTDGLPWFELAGAGTPEPIALSGATWNDELTVATVPLPAGVLVPGRSYSLNVQNVRLVTQAGGFVQGAVVSVFVAQPTVIETSIIKKLQMPEGVDLPSPVPQFKLIFTPIQIQLQDNPVINSRPVTDFENLLASPQHISVDATAGATENGVRTYTGKLDLWTLLSNLNFPGGGVYVWEVEEEAGSSNTVAPSHMDYDSSTFELRVIVNRYGIIEIVQIIDMRYEEGYGYVAHKGLDMTFVNTLTRDTTHPFVISKTIPPTEANRFANLSTEFTFTLTLTEHVLAPIETPLSANITRADGTVEAVTLTLPTSTLVLKHDESLSISTLPVGTTFSVTEAAHSEFIPQVVVTVGGVSLPARVGTVNTALATGDDPHIVRDGGSNAAAFVNNHNWQAPTGLSIANAPIIVPILIVIALALLAVARSRKRIEEIPYFS